jgi:hypothetical protein
MVGGSHGHYLILLILSRRFLLILSRRFLQRLYR